jgi:hypothetical protein
MSEQSEKGITQIFASNGNARGTILYELRLEGDRVTGGTVRHSDFPEQRGPQAVPEVFPRVGRNIDSFFRSGMTAGRPFGFKTRRVLSAQAVWLAALYGRRGHRPKRVTEDTYGISVHIRLFRGRVDRVC